jgi:protocatechuate 3,4-dioxygenase beta subunit
MLSVIVKSLYVAVIVTLAGAFLFQQPATTLQNANSSGATISGRVVDDHGKPVSSALISAERSDIIMIHLPSAYTNKNGEFVIQGVTTGQYTLHTRKEEDGYPRSEFNFYDKLDNADRRVRQMENEKSNMENGKSRVLASGDCASAGYGIFHISFSIFHFSFI